jgi:hypothetical protein
MSFWTLASAVLGKTQKKVKKIICVTIKKNLFHKLRILIGLDAIAK